MTRSLALGASLLLGLLPLCRAEQGCTPSAVQHSVADVKATQARLMAVKVDAEGSGVSPATQQEIGAFKEALAAAVDAFMQCKAESELSATELQAELASLLSANGADKASEPAAQDSSQAVDQVYGVDLNIAVARPKAQPQLRAIELRFGIDCGFDTVLLIYERRGGVWRRFLRWQSGAYEQVSGAFGDFFHYAIVPNGKPAQLVVAVAHGHPWCTSRWSGFDLDVIQPARDGVGQRVLLHKEGGYVRDTETVMKVKSDGFELRLEKGCLDMGIMTRPGIYRYRITGANLQRVQPIAMNGRDFVDEWLQADWADAVTWSAESNLGSLKAEHARIAHSEDSNAKGGPLLSYGPVRRCSGSSRRFQVELDQDPGEPTFFQLQQGENSFTMLSASHSPASECKGPDLMSKH